jgi:rare lipoprotein A
MKRRTLLLSLGAIFVPRESSAGISRTGIASWYGGRWHGRKTASGERFNKNAMTCAYNNANFGQKLRVTKIKTGESVIVTVNDRIGHPARIIDLSEKAAKGLDLIKKGLGLVRIVKI